MAKNKKGLITGIIVTLILAVLAVFVVSESTQTKADEVSAEWAEEFVNSEFDKMASGTKAVMTYLAEKNEIKVNGISYGENKDILLDCSVKTVDVYSAVSPHYDELLSTTSKKETGLGEKSKLDIAIEFKDKILAYIKEAPETQTNVTIALYQTEDGIKLYSSKEAVDAVFGGIVRIEDEVKNKETVLVVNEKGNKVEKKIEADNIKKGLIECVSARYDDTIPDTSNWLGRLINSFKTDFRKVFIEYDRWRSILSGLGVTLSLTFFSAIIGIVLGFIIAFIRCTYLKQTKHGIVLKVLNGIAQTYLTVIRGTPAVVQIMVIYFVIFMPIGLAKFPSAVICFGLNSGAYVAEIVRGGIMSVDIGQTEAGRSLGFNYMQTMWHIVFPQAFKAVLPSLANEFVVLLKETSVAFYIGLGDLMYEGNAIRAATYSAFFPLVSVAVIYFILVLLLSRLVGILERRLRNSER